ncbi:MAG: protein kinase domain-containing protein [Bacteroidales bacterium]
MEANAVKNISMFDSYEIPYSCFPRCGEIIDNYTIEKKLGEGAFGSVFKVINKDNNRIYALKLLNLFSIPYEEERKGIMKRFKMEYETGRIESEFLVHSHDYGKISGNPYIVMDFCNGGDLRSKIGNNQEIEKVNSWAYQVLNGLKILHQNGKVHRDLKPDNVLLSENLNAKLTDFGIAGHKSMRMTKRNIFNKPSEIFGTIAYMPPEQLNPSNMHVTILPTIDVFAFGTMFYEIFSGHYPFGPLNTDADLANYNKNVMQGNIIDISRYGVNLPEFWSRVFKETLQPNYKNRIQNVDDLLLLIGKPSEKELINYSFNNDEVLLQIMQGDEFGKVYNLSNYFNDDEGVITIGRRDAEFKNNIDILENETCYISRKHASIERLNGSKKGYFIVDGQWDMGSRIWKKSLNGTFVNSEPISDFARKLLIPGDIITIGDVTLKVINKPRI